MNFNEIAYLLLGLGGGIFFCWLYFKYKLRNMPRVLELLDKSRALHKKTREALDMANQKVTLESKEKELDRQLSNLSKNLEGSKDSLH